jgi:hypothetical protein
MAGCTLQNLGTEAARKPENLEANHGDSGFFPDESD